MEATFLGTGTSTGVPMIGCSCRVCTSADPRDRRLRSGLLLRHGGFHLLVDVSPDFREQVLRHRIGRVDAVLLTHPHVDHLFGLDDLRRFNLVQKSAIPVFATPETIASIHRIFEYLFVPAIPGAFLPDLDFRPVEAAVPFDVGPFRATAFDVFHGLARTVGYRIEAGGRSLAYASDCRDFPEAAYDAVRGVDAMVLDALRLTPHPSHFSFDESLAVLRRIGARQSFFTHIGHDLLHSAIATRYAPVRPACDGLVFTP